MVPRCADRGSRTGGRASSPRRGRGRDPTLRRRRIDRLPPGCGRGSVRTDRRRTRRSRLHRIGDRRRSCGLPGSADHPAAGVRLHDPDRSPIPAIDVADTGQALLQLGRAARRRLDAAVVGVTGSVGKTSVKDLLSAIGAARLIDSRQSGVVQQRTRCTSDPAVGPRGRRTGHRRDGCPERRPHRVVVLGCRPRHRGRHHRRCGPHRDLRIDRTGCAGQRGAHRVAAQPTVPPS